MMILMMRDVGTMLVGNVYPLCTLEDLLNEIFKIWSAVGRYFSDVSYGVPAWDELKAIL